MAEIEIFVYIAELLHVLLDMQRYPPLFTEKISYTLDSMKKE